MPANHRKIKDLAGLQFGKWTVLRYSHNERGIHHWLCRCLCGRERPIEHYQLLRGKTRSCIMCARERLREPRHGYYGKETKRGE